MVDSPYELTLAELACQCRNRLNQLAGGSGRLFHGRAKQGTVLEHVVIDAFSPVLVITTYKDVEPKLLFELRRVLGQILQMRPLGFEQKACLLHQHRAGSVVTWECLIGELPENPTARHLGLNFELQLGKTQNIGVFLDMELGHRLIRDLAPNARILNLFAYTCLFSVIAMHAGAQQVVNVDLSKSALQRGTRNHRLNHIETRHVKNLSYNVMKSWSAFRRLGPFDVVICDPPTSQKGAFEAVRDYPKMAPKLAELLVPDGFLIACLNAPTIGNALFESWFQKVPLCLRQRHGRPEIYGEADPDKDLKIHLYQRT